jgi:7-carboxy-7-deazaguanine synthase
MCLILSHSAGFLFERIFYMTPSTSLTVTEIFYSIQGESLCTGLPCVFIRLTGCNLRCSYCDTRYAYDGGQNMPIVRILAQIASYRCMLVAITGGEPLLQGCTPLLIDTLLENGYTVLLETNGSFDIRRVNTRCIRIVDIKCPSSGESHQNDWGNLNRLTPQDQVKFVIGNRNDFEFAKEIVPRISRIPCGNILFSNAAGQLTPDVLAEWILEDQLTVRLQIQLHKILWPDIERGV